MQEISTYRLKAILSHVSERFSLCLINTNTENELAQIREFLDANKIIKINDVALEDNKLWERVNVEIEWDVSDIASATGDQEFADNLNPEIRIQTRVVTGANFNGVGWAENTVAILSLNLPYLGRTDFVLYGYGNPDNLGVLRLKEIENYKTLYFSI